MGTIRVNGKTVHVPNGASISVRNGEISINGKKWEAGDDVRIGDVVIDGNVGEIRSEASVTVNGDVSGPVRAQGSVNANNISGDVTAGGSVNAHDISGKVSAGGSVNANKISS